MSAHLIPKSEQLEALADGLASVYELLGRYLGDLNTCPIFDRYITVTRKELADYLRQHPELVRRHIYIPGTLKYHECPVLEIVGDKYRVYRMDHSTPESVTDFDSLPDAAAMFLLWQFPSSWGESGKGE